MCLQLADKSVKYPMGILENLLVRVESFMFPVDFVVLDIREDEHVPLILGRPFLRTARALIDVSDGRITLRVGDDSITFGVNRSRESTSSQVESACFLGTFMSHVDRCIDYICGADLLDRRHQAEERQEVEIETVVPVEHDPGCGAGEPPDSLEVDEVVGSTEEVVEKPPFTFCYPPSVRVSTR